MSSEAAARAVGLAPSGRYTDLEYLAEGGMQYVFRAYDSALRRSVVLKTPKNGLVDRRFRRGAELSSRLNHPNIAATYDYYEDDDVTYLAEEIVDGLNLRQLLNRDYFFLDPWLASTVIHQLARAVSVAHGSGVVHRDLKPSNILVADEPSLSSVKLTDFGIAKLSELQIGHEIEEFHRDETTITRSQTLLGALPYMAPECWDDWTNAGLGADVWALGAILYELLSGELPFGSGPRSIVRIGQYVAGTYELDKPSSFGKTSEATSLETDLWSLIESALTVDEQQRISSGAFLDRCERLSYASSPRRVGTVTRFPSPNGYPWGFLGADGVSNFFHRSSFVGPTGPKRGMRVSFSAYPGSPTPRCNPVLAMRPLAADSSAV